MATISLASYTVRVKEHGKPGFLQLSSFSNQADLLPLFEGYCRSLNSSPTIDSQTKKMFKIRHVTSRGRSIDGLIDVGEYGYENELVNIDSLELAYRQRLVDAVMIPFFFLLSIPTQTNEGLLILQRFGTYGIRKILLSSFMNHFRTLYPDHIVEFNHLAPAELLNQYMRGDGLVLGVKFVSFSLPRDFSEFLGSEDHQEDVREVGLYITARRYKDLKLWGKMRDIFEGKRKLHGMIEIGGFHYDTIKIDVDINGSQRTIDIGRPNMFRANYDITNRVKRGSDGHPFYADILSIATEWLDELRAGIRKDKP
jgi:hypothetical protein